MDIVDLILNIAAVLLWINWIMALGGPGLTTPNTLLGTLRRAEPSFGRHWIFIAALPFLLTVRAWIYWEVGSSTTWIPTLDLGSVSIAFRCDLFARAFAFSVLSFTVALSIFYLALVLLSVLNRHPQDPDPFGRFVRLMLGPIGRLNVAFRLLLPLFGGMLFWIALSFLFGWMQLLPAPESWLYRLEQGLLVGLGAYLPWSHIIAVTLLLYLVSSYVHLGNHPLWGYVESIGRTFLTPFRRLPVQIGRIDLAPLVALGVVYLAARMGDYLLLILHRKLPL